MCVIFPLTMAANCKTALRPRSRIIVYLITTVGYAGLIRASIKQQKITFCVAES